MAKKYCKHLLILLFIALLTFNAWQYTIPSANASSPAIEQKGLTILSNIVGLDLDKYNTTLETYQPNSQPLYLGEVSQESVVYNLTSSTSAPVRC